MAYTGGTLAIAFGWVFMAKFFLVVSVVFGAVLVGTIAYRIFEGDS